jgi:hypothetical protein
VRQALAPLHERNFAWFFASQFVNIAGSMMAGIALAFAILEISDSASAIGQVLAARTIPMVLFLLWGGVIADRISRTLIYGPPTCSARSRRAPWPISCCLARPNSG